MKHRPYPNNKPSGVEWLGDVPEHWEVKRLKNAATINDETLPETTDPGYEFDYVDIGSVNAVEGICTTERMVFENAPSRARRKVQKGDTIVSTVRTYLRAIAPIAREVENLVVSTGFTVVRPSKTDAVFLSYALRESSFVESVVARSVGVSYPAVNASEVGGIPIPFPPLSEQHAIAAFLDRETTRLDTLVAKKRELMERLNEKRTALISRTVTRGLPPDAARAAGLPVNPPLKPSGVEWLGDVPEHWEVTTVLKMAQQIQTGPFGSQLHTSDYVEDGIPLVNPAHIISGKLVPDSLCSVGKETSSRLNKYHLQTGDIIMGRRGEIGRCAVVSNCESGWLCGTGSLIIRFWEGEPSFFYYIFSATGFNKLLELHAVGSTMLNINPSLIGRMLIPLPPLPEQQAIAAYLDTETAKIDALVAKIEEAIERLQEYRTALITAAVTGKVDVRVMSGVASDGKRGRG